MSDPRDWPDDATMALQAEAMGARPLRPDEVLLGCVAARSLLDGRIISLCPMAFGNLRLNVGDGEFVEHGFCYHDHPLAWAAFEEWSGDGDPAPGWAKDPYTGRLGHCPCDRCTHERTQPWNQARIAR